MVKTAIFSLSLLALFTVTSGQTCTGSEDPGTGTKTSVRYYYDTGKKQCFPFQYNGEGGNTNNHISENACKCSCTTDTAACADVGSSAASCKLPLKRGDCALNIKQFYFDIKTNKCTQATFGCKGTNGNHFATLDDCKKNCEVYAAGAKCTDPMDNGNACDAAIAPANMFFYNTATNECELFIFLGCGGNQNKYSSYLDCKTTCVKSTFVPPDDCNVAKDEASACSNKQWTTRYYYSTTNKECRPFVFAQCTEANKNNFLTLKDCQEKCHPPSTCTGLPADCNIGTCVYGYKRDKNDCPECVCQSDPCAGLQCAQDQRCRLNAVLACKYPPCSVTGVCVKYKEICEGSLKATTCTVQTAYTPRYSYNKVTKVCELRFFHGCAGPNNFLTVRNCEHVCLGTPITSSKVCPDPVCTCTNNIGWNRDSNNCPISCRCPNTPGGTPPTTPPTVPVAAPCTSNMCSTGFTCVQRCNTYPACTSTMPHCVDRGSCATVPTSALGNCNGAARTMWYWTSGGCRSFQWTGCTPNNLNFFVNQGDCTRACGTTTPTPTPSTQCPTYSCAHCPGGTGTAVMSGNCRICQCSSTPPTSTQCPQCNTGCNSGFVGYATGNTLSNGCPECKCKASSTTGSSPTPSSNVCGASCLQSLNCGSGKRPQVVGKDNGCDTCSCIDCSQCRITCPQGQTATRVRTDNLGCAVCTCQVPTPVPVPAPSATCANMPCFCNPGQTPVRDVNPATGQCRCQCQPSTSSTVCDCSTKITCSSGDKAVLKVDSTAAACNCECCATTCRCPGSWSFDTRGCVINCNCLTNPAPAPAPCTRDPSTCPNNCPYSTTWHTPSGATCERCECQQDPCHLSPPSCPAGSRCKPKSADNCRQSSCPATAICAVPSTVCHLSADRGTCATNPPLTRYRYDPAHHSCEPFAFSGCGGNDNNFAVESACMSFCAGV